MKQKTGYLIKWVYVQKCGVVPIDEEECLYSSTMKQFVPVGSGQVHMFIKRDGGTYFWMNSAGIFHADVSDDRSLYPFSDGRKVVPHLRCGNARYRDRGPRHGLLNEAR